MRIIAGDLKGRRIEAVPGTKTRPTSDKIKEAVFQMMGPFFDGGTCLDLFAGSGSLGIEAISRGIDYAVFIDRQRTAIQTIHKNIKTLNIKEKTEVSRMDAYRALRVIAKNNQAFDLILIDPPYEQMDYTKLIEAVIEKGLIKDEGLIYCEHGPAEELPRDIKSLHIVKEVNYGSTTSVTIYRKLTID